MTDTLTSVLLHPAASADAAWWRHAVIYQIYPRSWADGDGDGIGDLPGVTARLPYLRDLGVDAVWLSPFYTSPQADAGYDVADYRDIDPLFGTLADADAMVARAHELGLRVIVDLVPNHTSDEHAWFRAALAAGPGSPERARYIFRDGKGEHGELPPNDWRSVFGGDGWTRVTEADGSPGQWYLHLFDTKQPDLDWDNPEVGDEFESILRFWLDRGIDGFRVDVAHGLVKEPGLPDYDVEQHILDGELKPGAPVPPMWDQDGVHEVYRRWHRVLAEYGAPDRILVRRGVGPPAGARRPLRPAGRDAPGVQLRLPQGAVDGAGPALGHRLVAGGRRLGRGAEHLGAVQPRRRAARLAARPARRRAPAQRHQRRRTRSPTASWGCGGPGRRPR